MRRFNLKDDFMKLKELIMRGNFGELAIRIVQITPIINRLYGEFAIKRLYKNYKNLVDVYASKYNSLIGGGGIRI